MDNKVEIWLLVKKGSEDKPELANKEVHDRFVRNIFNLIWVNIPNNK